MLTAGGSLGYDDYALIDGVPVHASTIAGRLDVTTSIGVVFGG